MAGALTTATWKLNAASPVSLTVTDGAVNEAVDMNIAGCYACSTDKKTILVNRLLITGVDEDDVEATHTIYLARDFHKQLRCLTTKSATQIQVDASTKMQEFLAVTEAPKIGFWMPAVHNGTSFAAGGLSVEQLNDLGQIGGTIHLGAKLTYVDTTAKYKYAPIDVSAAVSWEIATANTTALSHPETLTPTYAFTMAPSRKYVSCDPIPASFMSSKVFDFFGLALSDIDASSDITVELFAYVGAEMSSVGTTAPDGIGLIVESATTYWGKTNPRVSGESEVTIQTAIEDTYNSETIESSGYAWVSNYNSGATTDSSITIVMGT